MKSIIIYYSMSGKTEDLAKKAAAALGSDILKVEVEKPYRGYIGAIFRMIMEKAKGVIPAVKTQVPALAEYDTILIGYPVWASDLPSFLSGFVQKCGIKGKKVIPFATFGGSGIESTLKTINTICPECQIVHPLGFKKYKKDEFDKWIEAVRS